MSPNEARMFQSELFMEKIAEDEELARELLGAYLEDAPERFGQLVAALEQGDAGRAAELAHSLKGMIGVLRQTGLSDFALEMELACRAGDLGRAQGLKDGLGRMMDRVDGEIRVFLKTLPVVL